MMESKEWYVFLLSQYKYGENAFNEHERMLAMQEEEYAFSFKKK